MPTKKEVIFEMRVPLAGEMFEDAEKISALKRAYEAIVRESNIQLGEGKFSMTTRTKTTRTKADGSPDVSDVTDNSSGISRRPNEPDQKDKKEKGV